MRKRLGSWNPTRGIWETEVHDLLSEHSEPFSETWPSSGSMQSGEAFELLTPEPLTDASGSSSSPALPTPRASRGASGTETMYALGGERTNDSRTQGEVVLPTLLLKTPTAQLAVNGGSQHPAKRIEGGHGPTLADEIEHLLPTPITSDAEQSRRHTTTTGRSHSGTSLTDALLPTPSAAVSNDGEAPDTWIERYEKHASKTDELATRAGMPLTITAQLLATGDLSRLRFAGGKPSSDE